MAAHLEGLLEINFLGSPSKYGDGSPFNHSIGVALRMLSNKGTQLDNPKQPACFNEPIVGWEQQPIEAAHTHGHARPSSLIDSI